MSSITSTGTLERTQGGEAITGPRLARLDRLARRVIHGRLATLRGGRLRLVDRDGVVEVGDGDGPSGELRIHDGRAHRRILLGGGLGAADAFIDGQWSSPDLTTALRVLLRNHAATDGFERGPARVAQAAARMAHRLRRNSRTGSRRNIAAHYDLGNDFFERMLDPTMSYSCAIFDRPGQDLEAASLAKLDRLGRKLALTGRDHLLEIGTGWGGLAEHMARRFGCRVTTTTISARQHEAATARIRAAGLQDRVTVLLRDYRDLEALGAGYDALVSVEMIEAVGHERLPTFFDACGRLLRPGGCMALQAITMPDQRYERYRRSVDFIRSHVFPGSCVPSTTAMLDAMTAGSDLRLAHLEEIGPHYAETLRRWRANVDAAEPAIRALGHDDRFLRQWRYYLCYCEAGFEEHYTGNVQMVLRRPGGPAPVILGNLEHAPAPGPAVARDRGS